MCVRACACDKKQVSKCAREAESSTTSAGRRRVCEGVQAHTRLGARAERQVGRHVRPRVHGHGQEISACTQQQNKGGLFVTRSNNRREGCLLTMHGTHGASAPLMSRSWKVVAASPALMGLEVHKLVGKYKGCLLSTTAVRCSVRSWLRGMRELGMCSTNSEILFTRLGNLQEYALAESLRQAPVLLREANHVAPVALQVGEPGLELHQRPWGGREWDPLTPKIVPGIALTSGQVAPASRCSGCGGVAGVEVGDVAAAQPHAQRRE